MKTQFASQNKKLDAYFTGRYVVYNIKKMSFKRSDSFIVIIFNEKNPDIQPTKGKTIRSMSTMV